MALYGQSQWVPQFPCRTVYDSRANVDALSHASRPNINIQNYSINIGTASSSTTSSGSSSTSSSSTSSSSTSSNTTSPNVTPPNTFPDEVTPDSVYNGPRRLTNFQRYISNPYVAPVFILGIQAFLLLFSWSFYGSVMRRPIPLNPTLAILAQACPQSVTYITTMVCSVISMISLDLYKRSINYAVCRRLTSGVSIYSLSATNQLAQLKTIDNFRRPAWTVASLFAILAAIGTTAGYTTLFQPKRIELKFAMTGFELDLRSPDFQALMESNTELFAPGLFNRVLPLIDGAGSTAINTHFHLPSVFNFDQFSYFNSTQGILPVATQPLSSNARSARGNILPLNTVVHQTQKVPPGFPARFSMTQQGFSGDVKCEKQDLNNMTRPAVRIASMEDNLFGTPVTLARLEVTCPNQTEESASPSVLTSNAIDAMFAVPCGATDNGRRRWDLIIVGSGKYSTIGTTVCSFFPEIHTLDVNYSTDAKRFDSAFPNVVNASEPWNRQDAPWLGDFAIDVFRRGLHIDQTATANAMGDTVLSFLAGLPDEPDVLNHVLAQYLRSVVEFSVTVLRTVLTQEKNRLFPGGESDIPPSMRILTSGTYYASTFGWNIDPDAAGGMLLAPTAISLAAIVIVIFSLITRRKLNYWMEPECNFHFDPTNILHVISAASAGGFDTPFPPFHEDQVAHAADVCVSLRYLEKRVGLCNDFRTIAIE